MRLFPPPLEIGDEEGFTPAKDIFGRAHLGSGLTNLVGSVSDPTVIAVDGQWGSGKTTFLKMWAGELRKSNFPVVYFDAFERDYVDDAFLAIASEIIQLAKEKKKANTSKGEALVRSAIGAGKVLLRSSLKLGVKAATLGAIAGADIEGISEDIATEASIPAIRQICPRQRLKCPRRISRPSK
jgi:nucleoside-triphosphatase THEP1